jgi:tetratricopeptide (TPR) repeat protein
MKHALALALLAALVLTGCATTRTPTTDDTAVAAAQALELVQTATRDTLARAAVLLAGPARAAHAAAGVAAAGRRLFSDLYPELDNPFPAGAEAIIDAGTSPFLARMLPVADAVSAGSAIEVTAAERMRGEIAAAGYLSPDSVLPPYLDAMLVLSTQGAVTEARGLLEEALRRSPDFYPAARRIADIIISGGGAGKETDRLVSLAGLLPGAAERSAALARAYLAAGNWDKAAEAAARGLMESPAEPRFALLRAEAVAGGGDWYEALRILEGLRRMAPGDPAAILLEARLLLDKEGNGPEALRVLDGAGAARAANPDFMELRGAILLGMERLDESETVLKHVLDLSPGRITTLSLLLREAVAAGRWDAALAWVVQIPAASRGPSDLRAAWQAATARGDFGQAVEFARQLGQKAPGPDVTSMEARSLIAADRGSEALALIDSALGTSTDGAARSELYLLRSRAGSASPADDLRLSLRESPDNVAALAALADLLVSEQDYRKALEYARRAAALSPADSSMTGRVRDIEARAAGQ